MPLRLSAMLITGAGAGNPVSTTTLGAIVVVEPKIFVTDKLMVSVPSFNAPIAAADTGILKTFNPFGTPTRTVAL